MHARLNRSIGAGLGKPDLSDNLKTLKKQLLPDGVSEPAKAAVEKAESWAIVANRSTPLEDTASPDSTFLSDHDIVADPVCIHPLTGASISLQLSAEELEAENIRSIQSLVHKGDAKKTALALWRFGSESTTLDGTSEFRLLPADGRIPDHSYWDHLDLTTALATSFTADERQQPAVFAVTIGPVQTFISTSRSTSDLWAASHLLSCMAWEAMRVVCETYGPDAVLFPKLRGVPLVDVWLRDQCGLNPELFEKCLWTKKSTDANPLFSAALPNRFTAIVPADQAQAIGEKIKQQVQHWLLEQSENAYRQLLKIAGVEDSSDLPGYEQIREQLVGFPEVYWASVPWPLLEAKEIDKGAADHLPHDALEAFFNLGNQVEFSSENDQQKSYPHPGTMYPVIYELLERLLASTKTLRPFEQLEQKGWRCSLTGEVEWLTTDRRQLTWSYRNQNDTLWAKVEKRKPSWVKKGEHLGALSALKRLWPTLFMERANSLFDDSSIQRFVVSTHTMAMCGGLSNWLDSNKSLSDDARRLLNHSDTTRVVLPAKLASRLQSHPDGYLLARLPGLLESSRANEATGTEAVSESHKIITQILGKRPEAYYGLLLMDGDRLGAWLSGTDDTMLPEHKRYHQKFEQPHVTRSANGFAMKSGSSGLQFRGSPARHMAISDALSNFTLGLAPTIVEEKFNGRILYAGGDDLMAMLPIVDLLPAMAALRAAYSGVDASAIGAGEKDTGFTCREDGFAKNSDGIIRLMGAKATASTGAVIAHHQAPLSVVLAELRETEQRAKTVGQRDAFSITIIKRAGGAVRLTGKWAHGQCEPPMTCLQDFVTALSCDGASRRAAYNLRGWIVDLPNPDQLEKSEYRSLLEHLMAYQMKRQNIDNSSLHAQRLAALTPVDCRESAIAFIENYLSVAEFLAREGRG